MRRGNLLPTVVWQSKYASRTLFSIFFKSNAPLFNHRLERGQTIDHQYYINHCLQPLIDEIKRQRFSYGTRGMKIQHNNRVRVRLDIKRH
jgi:hypothetical protein